jgi:hypothetical protein
MSVSEKHEGLQWISHGSMWFPKNNYSFVVKKLLESVTHFIIKRLAEKIGRHIQNGIEKAWRLDTP